MTPATGHTHCWEAWWQHARPQLLNQVWEWLLSLEHTVTKLPPEAMRSLTASPDCALLDVVVVLLVSEGISSSTTLPTPHPWGPCSSCRSCCRATMPQPHMAR